MKRGIGKKGTVEMSVSELGYLMLVAAIILISFFVISALLNSIYGKSTEQEAYNNAIALGNAVNKLIESSNGTSSKVRLSIPSGYVIVGFDTDWHGDLEDDSVFGESEGAVIDGKVEANVCSDNEGIMKPPQCEGVACICLYEDTWGDEFMEDSDDSDTALFCEQFFQGDISISGLMDSDVGYFDRNDGLIDGAKKYPFAMPAISGQEYEFLVLYGACDGPFDIQNVYLEKYTDSDKTYITFIPINKKTESLIEKREETLSS